MGGKQCLKELIRIDPHVRVLIASGHASDGDSQILGGEEMRGTVTKPFNMRELLRSVRYVLDGT